MLVGAGVDAVVNSKYRDAVRDAPAGYDTTAAFREHLESRLTDAMGRKLDSVAPLGSTAGYHSEDDALEAHYDSLSRQGYATLLNIRMRYGLYGTEAELVAELDAELVDLSTGKRIWDTKVFAVPHPVLASNKLGNPVGAKRTSESAPKLSVDEAAFARWTANKGEKLRAAYQEAVTCVTAALLNDLGIAHDAAGQLYLGKVALADKRPRRGGKALRRSLQARPQPRRGSQRPSRQPCPSRPLERRHSTRHKRDPKRAPIRRRLVQRRLVVRHRRQRPPQKPSRSTTRRSDWALPRDEKIEKALGGN